MKIRKVKGFSLVECIVAMALIGIASLLIAQVYGAVAIMNRNNAKLNTSLTEQIQYMETKADSTSSGVSVVKYTSKTTGVPPGSYDGKVDRMHFTATGGKEVSKFKTVMPEADIDVYVFKSDAEVASDGKTYGMDQDVRYKFIVPAG